MLQATHPDTRSEDKGFNWYHYPGGLYSLARSAGLCDTATGLMLRADIASDAKGERDMLVLDRGYPAYWLFALLNQHGHTFFMRLTTSFNTAVKSFVTSGRTSAIVAINPGREQHPTFKQHDLPIKPFSLRLVRILLPSGQIEVLATNLLDNTDYPTAGLGDAALYASQIESNLTHTGPISN